MIMTAVKNEARPVKQSLDLINVVGNLGVREAFSRVIMNEYVIQVFKSAGYDVSDESLPFNYVHLATTGEWLVFLAKPGQPDNYRFKVAGGQRGSALCSTMAAHYLGTVGRINVYDYKHTLQQDQLESALEKTGCMPLVVDIWSLEDIQRAGLDIERHPDKAALLVTYGRVVSAIAHFMRSPSGNTARKNGVSFSQNQFYMLIELGFQCVQRIAIEDNMTDGMMDGLVRVTPEGNKSLKAG